MTEPAEMSWREVADRAKGWLGPQDGPILYDQASQVAGLRLPLVEIGGYAGKSACWLGAAARDNQLTLFSVDTHRATNSPEMWEGRDCYDPEVVDADGLHDTLPLFRSTVRAAGLESWVVPVVGDSATVGRWWATRLSLLFIDGGHDTTVSADWGTWGRHVAPGGRVVFHDPALPTIRAAVELALAAGLVEMCSLPTIVVLAVP